MSEELTPDQLFGSVNPPSQMDLRRKQAQPVLDLFGGTLKGLWDTTIGGAVSTLGTFGRGAIGELKRDVSPAEQAFMGPAGGPVARAFMGGVKAVGSDIVEGTRGQGQRSADLFMGVTRDPLTGAMSVGDASPVAATANMVPFVGPGISEAIQAPTMGNIGEAIGQVGGTLGTAKLGSKPRAPKPPIGRVSLNTPYFSVPDDFLTLGQMERGTAHPAIAQAEATLAKTSAGRPIWSKFNEAQAKEMHRLGTELADTVSKNTGDTPTAVGKDIHANIAQSRESAFKAADASFEDLKARHGSTPVDLTDVKDFAKSELDRIGATKETIGSTQFGEVSSILESLVDSPNKTLTFKEMIDVRSALSARSRALAREGAEPRAGLTKQVIKRIDQAMDDAAKSGKFDATWRDANTAWKTAKDTFDRGFIKQLSKKDPALLTKQILKEGATPDSLVLAKKHLTRANWDRLKGQVLRDALDKATTETAGTSSKRLKGDSLRKWYDGLGVEKRKALFDGAESASIEKMISTAEAVGLHDIQGFGSFLDRMNTMPVLTGGKAAALGVMSATLGPVKTVAAATAGMVGGNAAMRGLSKLLSNPAKARSVASTLRALKSAGWDFANPKANPTPFMLGQIRILQKQIQSIPDEVSADELFAEK